MLYKYPQREFPYGRLVRGEPPPRQRRSPSSSCSTPASSTTTATSTSSSSTPRPRPDDILMRVTVAQPRPGGGAAARAAAALVPQHLVLEARTRRSRELARRATTASIGASMPSSGDYACYADGDADAAVLRQRDERRAAVRRRTQPTATSRTPSTSTSSTATHGAVNPAQTRHEGGGALHARRCRPAARVSVRAAADAASRRPQPFDDFDAVFDAAAARGRRVLRRAAGTTSPTPTRAACSGRRSPA